MCERVVSKSILERKPVLNKEEQRRFCLGLPGWCPCPDCSTLTTSATCKDTTKAPSAMEAAKGKKSLSLKRTREKVLPIVEASEEPSGKRNPDDDRFDFNITSDDLSKFMEGNTPANTEKSTSWAIRNFEEWQRARNVKFPNDTCPEDIFVQPDKSKICEWLCKFISETRKSDGEEYTPRSLYLILAGIQRHIRKLRPLDTINIFEDVQFKALKNVCDSIFKRLHRKGIGIETKETAVLSRDDEDTLWDKGVLDLDTPKGLLRAVFL